MSYGRRVVIPLSFTTVDASQCSYSLLVGPGGDLRVAYLVVNGYENIYKDNTRKHLRTHTMSNRRSIITTGLNYFAYLCCRSNRHCPQWLSNRILRLSKLRAITVNVTTCIGIVFCVDYHDSYTWLSTVCPANICKDIMRLYEYVGWSESSLDLLFVL